MKADPSSECDRLVLRHWDHKPYHLPLGHAYLPSRFGGRNGCGDWTHGICHADWDEHLGYFDRVEYKENVLKRKLTEREKEALIAHIEGNE